MLPVQGLQRVGQTLAAGPEELGRLAQEERGKRPVLVQRKGAGQKPEAFFKPENKLRARGLLLHNEFGDKAKSRQHGVAVNSVMSGDRVRHAGGDKRFDDVVGGSKFSRLSALFEEIMNQQAADLVARQHRVSAVRPANGGPHPVSVRIRADGQVRLHLSSQGNGHLHRFRVFGIGRRNRRERTVRHSLLGNDIPVADPRQGKYIFHRAQP